MQVILLNLKKFKMTEQTKTEDFVEVVLMLIKVGFWSVIVVLVIGFFSLLGKI